MTQTAKTKEWNVTEIRKQFPILSREVNGKQLVYLDNGATSQKPMSVIKSIEEYYTKYNSNIHRGVHQLSQEATMAYEKAREKIQKYIGAEFSHEVLFTSGTTDSINTVAYSFGSTFLKPGDEILISAMEHHSNIVPWQMVCEEYGAVLKVIPMRRDGTLIMERFHELLTDRVRIVSVVHISNALGNINPVREIIEAAHSKNIPVLIDGAQSMQHSNMNMKMLNADFFVFSGHKMFGPTGTGILYGKEKWLNKMKPFKGGGDMIKTVTFEKTTYNDLPHKFEAGTPNIEGGIALGAAIDFLNSLDWDVVRIYERELLQYATQQLKKIEGLEIYNDVEHKASVVSFNINGLHPYDVGTILDQQGIAVRTGHHCTQPIMDYFQIPGTVRASFALYNTTEEVDKLVDGVKKAVKMLNK
ncbi:MAG: aminotransferase class V-fold PLP-dependent enzyme [Flavobacteriales bacterium]